MRGLKSVQYLTVCWIGCLPTKTQPADPPLSPSQQGTKRSKRVDNQPISFMAITHVIKFWMAVLIVMMMMMVVMVVMVYWWQLLRQPQPDQQSNDDDDDDGSDGDDDDGIMMTMMVMMMMV